MMKSMREELNGQRVLELGAGCGMTGMAAAQCGAVVTSTDLPDSLPNLQRNLSLNSFFNGTVRELDWNFPSSLCEPSQYDIIIGCECVYHEPIVEPLVRTVDYHLKPGGVAYFVSAKHRHCFLHFFHLMLSLGYTITTTALEAPSSEEAGFTPSEDLTVGWFCEPEFESDKSSLICVRCQKPM